MKGLHRRRRYPEPPCAPQRLTETRAAIERYGTLEKELLGSLQYLNGCESCRPPRTTQEDCPHCPVDHGMEEPPALVAGFQISARPGVVLNVRDAATEAR